MGSMLPYTAAPWILWVLPLPEFSVLFVAPDNTIPLVVSSPQNFAPSALSRASAWQQMCKLLRKRRTSCIGRALEQRNPPGVLKLEK